MNLRFRPGKETETPPRLTEATALTATEPQDAALRNAHGQTLDDARLEFLIQHRSDLRRQHQKLQLFMTRVWLDQVAGRLGCGLSLIAFLALIISIKNLDDKMQGIVVCAVGVVGMFSLFLLTISEEHREKLPQQLRELKDQLRETEEKIAALPNHPPDP